MSEAKVISIGGAVHSERGLNQNALECVEDLMAKVKSGEIVGIVAAVQFADNSVGTSRAGYRKPYQIAGALLDMAMSEAKAE